MPIFQGYKGTGTPNSWEGLIDEALPCVGGCGAGGGGVPVPLFPKIFLDFPFSPNSKY